MRGSEVASPSQQLTRGLPRCICAPNTHTSQHWHLYACVRRCGRPGGWRGMGEKPGGQTALEDAWDVAGQLDKLRGPW
jgi:hypothetical protein